MEVATMLQQDTKLGMDMLMDRIESIFGLGKLQDFITLSVELGRAGLTFDDLKSHVVRKKETMAAERRGHRMPSRVCPEPKCTGIMILMPVNTGPRDQTGDDKDKSVWYCPECHFEEFSDKNMNQQIQDIS